MNNYERTIDLVHVFNYVKYNLKKIIKVTIVVAIVTTLLVVAKNLIIPNEEMYYSTSKILFKFNSWSTTEKDYSFENWNLNGSEQHKSDSNWDFLGNAKYVFASDRIITNIMDQYSIEEELSDFKKNIIVEHIAGTHMIRIIVKAESPELSKNIIDYIVESGIKSVRDLYDLKYEIIDEYTEIEHPFNTLEIKQGGVIETSSNKMDDIKLIVVITAASLIMIVAYYVTKCLLNNKVESVEMIENGFGIPVLQVLGKINKNYEITATKLINSGVKSILFTSIQEDKLISEDVELIAKKLVDRNKKVLIYCVGNNERNKLKEVYNAVDKIPHIYGIDSVSSSMSEYNETLNKYMKDYDFVLIEASSLDINSDSLLLSKSVDYTVLISKCNSISIDEYEHTINDFKRYSSGVDGVILKDVDKYSSSYKYIQFYA